MLPAILAHTVGPEGEGAASLARWSFDPIIILVVLLPAWLYARGLRNWYFRPSWFASWRPFAFYAGLFSLVIALCSPIDAMSDDLFFMHMAQHMLLQLIAPPLILLGAPTTPILRGLPRRVRQGFVRPIVRNQLARALFGLIANPILVWAAFAAANWGWHLGGGLYQSALESQGIHYLQHVSFMAVAMLWWVTVIDAKPLRSRLNYPARALFIGLTMFQNIYLGASLTFRKTLLYPHYADRTHIWNWTPLEDQQAGGALMWVGGDTLLLIVAVYILSVWFDAREKQSREEERRADERAARAAAQEKRTPVQ
ncbi:MAG: cytochrome c oxidase assembly protein [Chloroflexi bacterium]|nr:cytochrome c oxidase assembly protein [Chloroflexota bacterium]